MAHAPEDRVVGSRRRKPGKLFFVTVSLDVDDVSCKEYWRSDFLCCFDNLVSYCIALESSSEASKVNYHLHAFLEFDEPIFVDDLSEYIRSCYNNCRVDCQPCKSRRSCLKYISKEDTQLLTNIKVSSLHFNYRVYCWARSTSTFKYTDPFVVEHRFCYRFLKQYFDDFLFHEGNKFKCLYRAEHCFHNWTLECVIWWNKYFNSFVVKRPCLYLYGPSNVGKSTFIEMLIGKNNLKYVFYPGVGKFFMQGFRSDFHKVILFEEFDIKYHCVNMLKRLCEGRDYAYPVKCEPDKNIRFCGPIIFISNYREIADEALSNRLLFVSAEVQYWKGLPAVAPKNESLSDGEKENVYSIVSSEEEGDAQASSNPENVSEEYVASLWASSDPVPGTSRSVSQTYRV